MSTEDKKGNGDDLKPPSTPPSVVGDSPEKVIADKETSRPTGEIDYSQYKPNERVAGPRGFWFQKDWLSETRIKLYTLLFTLLTLIAAIFLYCITREQVGLSREANGQTRQALQYQRNQDSINRRKDSILVDATLKQNRAYVVVDRVDHEPLVAGERWVVRVAIMNVGQTPAQNCLTMGADTFGDTETFPRVLPWRMGSLTPSVSVVGTRTNASFISIETNSGKPFNPGLVNALQTKRYYLFVYGIITYDDLFGGKDTTKFAFRYNGLRGKESGFVACETNNDIK